MPSRFVPKYFSRDKLSKEDQEKYNELKNQIAESFNSNQKGDYEKGFSLAKQIFEEAEEFGKRPLLVDAIFCQGLALLGFGKYEKCLKVIKEGENLLESIEHIKKGEFAEKQAMLYDLKGIIHRFKGDTKTAFDFLQQSLSIVEKLKKMEALAGLFNSIGILYASQEKLDLALDSFQKSLKNYEDLEIEHAKIKLLNNFGQVYASKGELDKSLEYYQEGLILAEKYGELHSKATLLTNIGQIYHTKGELHAALENSMKSLAIFEDLDSSYEIAICLNNIGVIHELKGELFEAHDFYTKSFALFRELGNNPKIAMSYNNIGNTYLDGGDVDKAISHYQETLKLLENTENSLDTSITLYNLILVNLQLGSKENSHVYLQKLQEIEDKQKNRIISQIYNLGNALDLKTSERVIKRAEAQQIFQKITEEEIYQHEFTVIAKKNLCELLIQELTSSGNEEILQEIKEILQDLMTIAENQQSSSLLIEVYIMQSKMALLELDLDSARKLLNQAQQLAEEKGLQRLAVMVSREYDSLLTQSSKWTDLPDREASMAERLELAELESMVTRLIRKKAEIAELSEEEPVLFLILARSGMSMFSKHFVSDSLLADQLIGGFITAINAFTQQAFSESGTIEGIKHKEYTILMNPTDPLLCCYVFKGPSYYALQKLRNFSETVKVSDTIWDRLTKASSIGLDISGETAIEDLVTKTFLSSPESLLESTSEVFFGQKMNATIRHGIYLDTFYFYTN
ncbi:MAG: tetratricopeptide repeat protein [Promethearchaeota archaeon]